MTNKLIMILFVLLLSTEAIAGNRIQHEKWYQEKHCAGESEATLKDGTRVDCLTATHAIEYDFANKWCEAVGQALYYALKTGKRAGIVLIIERPKDRKYLDRLNSVIEHYKLPIDVWAVGDGVK